MFVTGVCFCECFLDASQEDGVFGAELIFNVGVDLTEVGCYLKSIH